MTQSFPCRMLLAFLLFGWLSMGSLMTAEIDERAAAKTPPAQTPGGTDLRDALALKTRERNDLAERAERLATQQWLLILYGLTTTVLVIGFAIALLRRSASTVPATNSEGKSEGLDEDDAPIEEFGGTTATIRRRKNATITIRNAQTQEEETVGNVRTRRFFARSSETPATGQKATASPAAVNRTQPIAVSADEESDMRPSTDRTRRMPEAAPPAQPITTRRPITVRVEHQSDRLTPVEVELKPGTAAIVRQGFSMLEVMIAMAVLATVLSSVIASIYTLHTAQVLAQQESRVEELGRLLSERLMGAQWDAIGRRNQSEANLGAWSWHRRLPVEGEAVGPQLQPLREGADVPEEQNLQALGLLSSPSGLDDLNVYLEYYTRDALDLMLIIQPNQSPKELWASARQLHRIQEESPADLSASPTIQTAPTLVFRIVITWNGYRSGSRQHEVLFARSK